MKTACFEATGCPGSSCMPIGMHFISSRAKRNPLVALLSTTSVVASRCFRFCGSHRATCAGHWHTAFPFWQSATRTGQAVNAVRKQWSLILLRLGWD
jgi:hypothetical protein